MIITLVPVRMDATLTLMLFEYLFEQPGFQHNPSADTERKLFFGAHCTAPSRMWGRNGPAERYALRSHAEAGWGCVPQVLLSPEIHAQLTQRFAQAADEMTARIKQLGPSPVRLRRERQKREA